MHTKHFVMAALAAVPLVISGCGSKSDDAKVTAVTTDGKSVEFGGNSTDVTGLPFYLDGTITLKALDKSGAALTPPTTRTQAGSNIDGTTANNGATDAATAKISRLNFQNDYITMKGEMGTVWGINAYVLTIATTDVTYKVGVARDLSGAIWTFNAASGTGDAQTNIPLLRALGSNQLQVWSTPTGLSAKYNDFTVNVPTAAGNDFAPYTGQVGCTKLVLSGTTNSFRLVKDEGNPTGASIASGSKTHVIFDWLNGLKHTVDATTGDVTSSSAGTSDMLTTAAIGTGGTAVAAGAKIVRSVKLGSAVPGMYWKPGYGFVECIGRVNDDKLFYKAGEGFTSAEGEFRGVDLGTTPATLRMQVTFTEYGVNANPASYNGYYVANYVVPHSIN